MENKQEFNKKVSDEVSLTLDKEIRNLLEKENLNLDEKNKLELLNKLKEQKKSYNEILRDNYYNILDVLDYYMDLDEDKRKILAIWTIGSCLHKDFNCYPYLFFNAMRGSGKTRVMKIISFLNNGILTTAPTEAVLFRCHQALALDEFERMDDKEKLMLKELLNTAYKKGLFVLRTVKRKILGQEDYQIEKYETYRPLCVANIWGMDDVLGDRCIQVVLEKSENSLKTKKIEDFDNDNLMLKIKKDLFQCSLCSVVMSGGANVYTKGWNDYVQVKYSITTLNTYNTLTPQTTLKDLDLDMFFSKVDETGLNGRTLELFFPLFIIAHKLGNDVLADVLRIAKEIGVERKSNDSENKDVLLYKFISELDETLDSWEGVRELNSRFKLFLGEENEDWVNPKWMGRALKRLNLIIQKRRVGAGVSIIPNVLKAKEQTKMFEVKQK